MAILVYGEDSLDKETELLYVYGKIDEIKPVHTHDFYEFFVVTKGMALHLINNSVQTICTGDLFFIRPKDKHCYDFYHSEDFILINIAFSRQMLKHIIHFFDNTKHITPLLENPFPKCVHLDNADLSDVIKEFLKLGDMLRCPINKKLISFHAQSYFALLLNDYFIEYSQAETTGKSSPPWLDEVLLEMQKIENLQEGFSKMADLSPCSKNHLCRLLKSTRNVTPTQYINEQRLNYSVYLLIQTAHDIITISQMAGFNNLSHFYHLFKKEFMCSPAKFREKHS